MRTDSVQSARRTLGTLQPSANDQGILVGSGGKVNAIDIKKVESKRRRLNFDLENKPPPTSAAPMGVPGGHHQHGGGCQPAAVVSSPSHRSATSRHGTPRVHQLRHNAADNNQQQSSVHHVQLHSHQQQQQTAVAQIQPDSNNNANAVISREAYDLMVRDDPTADYWKLMAEQRRAALEEVLKENEQLHEKIEFLEAENRHLQGVASHAAELAEMLKQLTAGDEDDEEEEDEEDNAEA